MKEPDLMTLSAMLETCFASFDEVVLAYLFGSYARGQAWAHSDVDVAVLLAVNPMTIIAWTCAWKSWAA
jgi:predicted nucleotidyltransferase